MPSGSISGRSRSNSSWIWPNSSSVMFSSETMPRRAAVLVEHDRHVGLALDELREQRFDRAVLRNEEEVALELDERPAGTAQLREEKVLHVNEADGLVERAVAERVARVARGADRLEVLLDRLGGREDDDVGARHHDLPRGALRELEDAFDDLAVLLREHAGFLACARGSAAALPASASPRYRGAGWMPTTRRSRFDARVEQPDHRERDDVEAAQDVRGPERRPSGLSMAMYFGPARRR